MSAPETTNPAPTSDNPAERLQKLLAAGAQEEARAYFAELEFSDRVFAMSRLPVSAQAEILLGFDNERASQLLRELPENNQAALLEFLPPETCAPIIDELRSDLAADVLGSVGRETSELILREMHSGEVKQTRILLSYEPDTAGGLMEVEFLSYIDELRVSDVLADLRANSSRYSDYEVQYAYITDRDGRLVGVLRMRDLLFAEEDRRVSDLMIPKPVRIVVTAKLPDLTMLFDDYGFLGVPVVDEEDRIVGVIRRTAVREAAEKQANKILLKISGIVGGEELRSMPLRVRAGRRLSWLSINIVLNIVAASVIAFYEDTLAQVITLAVFLPIISDMSGCSGNQAVAVSIRELATGLVRPREYIRVFLKESAIGIVNGIALGVLLGLVAYLWKGNVYLSLVVGGALAVNTLVSVCVGGLVPLMIKGLRLDPALVSGPMLTTVTDMCGFFFALSFATLALAQLAG